MAIIHSFPDTLSWIPRDAVNGVYNVGGTITVGTFGSLQEAKRVAHATYSIQDDDWHVSDRSPFESDDPTETENHTPDVDGHNIRRHGIFWK